MEKQPGEQNSVLRTDEGSLCPEADLRDTRWESLPITSFFRHPRQPQTVIDALAFDEVNWVITVRAVPKAANCESCNKLTQRPCSGKAYYHEPAMSEDIAGERRNASLIWASVSAPRPIYSFAPPICACASAKLQSSANALSNSAGA
jgi:hypothetical protein